MAFGQASACADAGRVAAFVRVVVVVVGGEEMGRAYAVLFVHLVWRTWDRLPLLRPDIERDVHRILSSEAQRMGCKVIAINGMADHVHVLVSVPTTLCVAEIAKQLKGVTSQWVNGRHPGPMPFKWQRNYGAFTVSRWDVERISNYIRNQKEHHARAECIDDLEQTANEGAAE